MGHGIALIVGPQFTSANVCWTFGTSMQVKRFKKGDYASSDSPRNKNNGSQFTSDQFKTFCDENGIRHVRVAPYHPSSNGEAERFVKTFKRAFSAMGNEKDPVRRLQQFLFHTGTPSLETGVSPAELLVGRQLRGRLDLLRQQTCITNTSHCPNPEVKVQACQRRQKIAYDKHAKQPNGNTSKDRAGMKKALQLLLRNTSALEQKWLIRIILKLVHDATPTAGQGYTMSWSCRASRQCLQQSGELTSMIAVSTSMSPSSPSLVFGPTLGERATMDQSSGSAQNNRMLRMISLWDSVTFVMYLQDGPSPLGLVGGVATIGVLHFQQLSKGPLRARLGPGKDAPSVAYTGFQRGGCLRIIDGETIAPILTDKAVPTFTTCSITFTRCATSPATSICTSARKGRGRLCIWIMGVIFSTIRTPQRSLGRGPSRARHGPQGYIVLPGPIKFMVPIGMGAVDIKYSFSLKSGVSHGNCY
eukprot:Em0004g606a